MTDATAEFRVTITGPEQAREELLHQLSKLEGEAERAGVDVRVERIETTRTSLDAAFD